MRDYQEFSFSHMPYGFGWFFMILFWLIIIVGIVAVMRWLLTTTGDRKNQEPVSAGPETAIAILRERYARGEIDHDEYRQRLEELNKP